MDELSLGSRVGSIAIVENDNDAMCLTPSAMNVKVKKFNQALVNGRCNYDTLKVAKCPFM